MIKRLLVCILTFYSMSLSIALHASLQQPGSALDPMVTPHFDSFYIAERAVLPKARKVSITDVSVSFDSNWLFKCNT